VARAPHVVPSQDRPKRSHCARTWSAASRRSIALRTSSVRAVRSSFGPRAAPPRAPGFRPQLAVLRAALTRSRAGPYTLVQERCHWVLGELGHSSDKRARRTMRLLRRSWSGGAHRKVQMERRLEKGS
jgi:hypothetical protein